MRSARDRQDALRQRLRELAAVGGRFGYRRLTVLLKREGWRVNAKRTYRLYGMKARRCARNRGNGWRAARVCRCPRLRDPMSGGPWTSSALGPRTAAGFE